MKLFTAYSVLFHLFQGAYAEKPTYTPDVPYWPPGKEPIDDPYAGDKIVGGEAVQPPNRYPYMVALTTREGASSQFCGGSLIAPNWVLSAAHCAGIGSRVQIGRYNFNDVSEDYEDIPVVREITHPDYNPSSFDNDFMLIELSRNSAYSRVSIDDGTTPLSPGRDVTAIGWGTTSSGGNLSPTLLEVEVDIVGNNECNNNYGGDITDSMVCASRQGKDACQGDSGGPLITKGNDNTNDILVGDTSWGYGCANIIYPGVYGRISKAYGWISTYVSFGPTPSPTTSSPTITPAPTMVKKPFSISITTDDYPSETSWDIRDQSDTVIEQAGAGDLDMSETTFTWDLQLVPQCSYKFTIYDSFSDGICCGYGSGYYELRFDGDLIKTGGEFGSFETTEFGCVTSPPVGSTTPSPSSPPIDSPDCLDSPLTMVYTADSSSYKANFPCDFISDVVSDCLCTDEIVKSHCPVTCESCSEYACEDSTATLINPSDSSEVSCTVLSNLSADRIQQICQSPDVFNTCRDTCGNCVN